MWKWILSLFALSFCLFAIQSGDTMMYLTVAQDFILAGDWRQLDVHQYLYPQTDGVLIWQHEYLSSLLFYGAWWLGDWAGVILLKTIVLAILFWATLNSGPEKQNAQPVWIALWALAIHAASFRFIERASLFSDLFSVLMVCWLLKENRLSKSLFIRLSVMFTLWIQLHPGFIIGFLLLGIWCLWHALMTPGFERGRLLYLLLIPLMMLINPAFVEGFTYPFRFAVAEVSVLKLHNFEWLPPYHSVFRFSREMLSFWFLIMIAAFFFFYHRTWRALPALFSIAALLFSLQAVRFVPFAALIIVVCVKPWSHLKVLSLEQRWLKITIASGLILFAAKNFIWGYQSSSGWRVPSLTLDKKFFPEETLSVLNQLPPEARAKIYNSHDFGAYLLWRGIRPVFHHGFVTDMKFYREEVIGALQSKEQFLALATKYNWQTLLIDKNNSYRQAFPILSTLPEWKIVAADEAAYLIVRLPFTK